MLGGRWRGFLTFIQIAHGHTVMVTWVPLYILELHCNFRSRGQYRISFNTRLKMLSFVIVKQVIVKQAVVKLFGINTLLLDSYCRFFQGNESKQNCLEVLHQIPVSGEISVKDCISAELNFPKAKCYYKFTFICYFTLYLIKAKFHMKIYVI